MEVIAPTAAHAAQSRGQIALIKSDGTAAVPSTSATVIADLPATGNTADDVAVKLNALLAALRTAGITKAS
jgi:hypothetical protein